ncbi:MAG: biotin synthase BioB [Coxiellaceae bacterium]|jgi:biotin synthase|nr:biotin synthase BioB [Coxiellaceae bacterium]
MQDLAVRHDWSLTEIAKLFALPFIELLSRALMIRQRYFLANRLQISSLLNIKTGACSEDCAYCAQSSHYKTELKTTEDLFSIETVIAHAKSIKAVGGSRFCMGAAWRSLPEKNFPQILEIIREVKKLGLETCMSLGMLTRDQTKLLKEAGLDYYNHNLDTSEKYYRKIITTRTYQERLTTLENLRNAGIKVCCGGIIGMGESLDDRIELLHQLATFPEHPHSVPINYLIPMSGTPLANIAPIDPFDFVRVIAVARILMPQSFVRLAAGRDKLSDELQALCFCAGTNSIFCGERLLTAKNPSLEKDRNLLQRLGIDI